MAETVSQLAVRWLYVNGRAKTVHALLDSTVRTALCGLAPAWWKPAAEWMGLRSAAEVARAASLPRCSRCVRVLAARQDRPAVAQTFASPTVRPSFEPAIAEFYDWLKANGVDEWLPDQPEIEVAGDRLTYTAFRWAGERGWVADFVRAPADDDDPVTEFRTVPLLTPVTPRFRELSRVLGFALSEE